MTQHTPEVEEIEKEFVGKLVELIEKASFGAPLDYAKLEAGLTETLTTLTQHHEAELERAVEAERGEWVNGKHITQFITIDWDGEKITEKYVDNPEYETEENLNDLLNEIVTPQMKGKYKGSYSLKILRYHVEGQMSHPETGQWDFPPYYEVHTIYYKRSEGFNGYKALAPTKTDKQ